MTDWGAPISPKPNPQWSQDQGIAYEVTRDLVNDVTGIIRGYIYAEEEKPNPDLDTIGRLEAQISYYIDARDSLVVTDGVAVEKLQAECSKFLASWRKANMPLSELTWGQKLAGAVRHLSKYPSTLAEIEKRVR